jgi:integrase/recombinase XerD
VSKRRRTARLLRPDNWPASDRRAWASLARAGDPFDDPNPAAAWSPATRRKYAEGYGVWLAHLKRATALDDTVPASRVTPSAVNAFVQEIVSEVAPSTAHAWYQGMMMVIRAMAPDGDWAWMTPIARRLERRIEPAGRLVPATSDVLFRAGLEAMAAAERRANALDRAVGFRDGLIVALLASRPVRRRNLAMMRLGVHLVRQSVGYRLAFEDDEMKTNQGIAFGLPDELVGPMDRYLAVHRPVLLGPLVSDAVWISREHTELQIGPFLQRVKKLTRAAVGTAMPIHGFRSALATTMAIHSPETMLAGSRLLGHRDPRTTARYYNMANSLDASRRWQSPLLAIRHKGRRRSR